MGHRWFVVVADYSRFLTGLSAPFGMTRFLLAYGTTEVVPLPIPPRNPGFPQTILVTSDRDLGGKY